MSSELPISEIYSDSDFNCRGTDITPFEVSELAADIRLVGLLQPITVQPYDKIPGKKYRILIGHRRFAAVKSNGSKTIACEIRSDLDEVQALRINFSENIKRKDLNPIQEATHLAKFLRLGLTLEETGKLVGFSTSWVGTRVKLLTLPPDIQKEVAAGIISLAQAATLIEFNGTTDELYSCFREMKDAKARGDRSIKQSKAFKSLKANVKSTTSRKVRNLFEVNQMKDIIIDAIGPCLAARVLAWSSGHISGLDLLFDIEQEAKDKNIDWEIPPDILRRAVELNDNV